MAAPGTDLEEKQRKAIEILSELLGMEGSADGASLEAILAAGGGQPSLKLQKENDKLKDKLARWNTQMTWATEQVKLRDTLLERVAAAKDEVEAAEAQVEPLRAECKALEQQQQQAVNRKTQLQGSKMQCERTLVTLPADIAKLREATAALEVEIEELQPAVTTLEEERSTLAEQRDRLEAELTSTEAELAAQRQTIDETRARVSALQASTAESEEALTTSQEVLTELSQEEEEMAGAYEPRMEELATVREEITLTAKRLATLQKRNNTLGAALDENHFELKASKLAHEKLWSSLTETRLELSAVRKERNQYAAETEEAQREINESEALTSALLEEMNALKTEAPALFARRDKVVSTMGEALDAVERFESGQMAAALGFDPEGEGEASKASDGTGAADGGGDGGEGAALDARIAETGRRLDLSAEEIDGRLKALAAFSETVQVATDTVTKRRDSAQRSLELLAVEQRRASEEMKLTLSSALTTMEAMQGEWDSAVAANAAELKALKADALNVAEKQRGDATAMESMRADIMAQQAAIGDLNQERRSLAKEEEMLRQRYSQLRQRRLTKLFQGGKIFPTKLPRDLEEVAEAAGANAEKAAVALLRFFGKDEPPTDAKDSATGPKE